MGTGKYDTSLVGTGVAFTSAEVSNIANAVLDNYLTGEVFDNAIQQKPLLKALRAKQKSFTAGRQFITVPVQFAHGPSGSTNYAGYQNNQAVSFYNPTNVLQAQIEWKEVHNGIQVSHTELKTEGIHVTDEMNSTTSGESGLPVIVNLLENKVADMGEDWAVNHNKALWRDGTQDSKVPAGLTYFITDDPTTGTVAALDRATYSLWRNRSKVGSNKIAASPVNQTLTETMRAEVLQLKRYGGIPNLILAGSGFLSKLRSEVQAKGNYTLTGFGKGTDISMDDISIQGIGTFQYDPTLDDLDDAGTINNGRNRCYIVDTKNVQLWVMDGEDMKRHKPARPYNQFTLYSSITWTGALVAKQCNGCGVYEAA